MYRANKPKIILQSQNFINDHNSDMLNKTIKEIFLHILLLQIRAVSLLPKIQEFVVESSFLLEQSCFFHFPPGPLLQSPLFFLSRSATAEQKKRKMTFLVGPNAQIVLLIFPDSHITQFKKHFEEHNL